MNLIFEWFMHLGPQMIFLFLVSVISKGNRLIDLVGRGFANGPGDQGHTKDFKNGTWYFFAKHSAI